MSNIISSDLISCKVFPISYMKKNLVCGKEFTSPEAVVKDSRALFRFIRTFILVCLWAREKNRPNKCISTYLFFSKYNWSQVDGVPLAHSLIPPLPKFFRVEKVVILVDNLKPLPILSPTPSILPSTGYWKREVH